MARDSLDWKRMERHARALIGSRLTLDDLKNLHGALEPVPYPSTQWYWQRAIGSAILAREAEEDPEEGARSDG